MKKESHRAGQLDALRAIAIIAVFVSHYIPTSKSLGSFGSWGVHLFFAMSGFLIAGILLKSRVSVQLGHSTAKHELNIFYIRRSLRIFPVFYLFILFCYLKGNWSDTNYLWIIFHSVNIGEALGAEISGVFGHLYTLAIEEQFYLLFPLFCLAMPRKYLGEGFLVLTVASFLYNQFLIDSIPEASRQLPSRVHAFAIGSLAAYYHGDKNIRKVLGTQNLIELIFNSKWIPITSLALFFIDYYYSNIFSYAVRQLLLSIGFTGIIVICWNGVKIRPISDILNLSFLHYIGKISYGMYLYHNMAGWFTRNLFLKIGITYPTSEIAEFFLCFIITFVVASVSWHAFEYPINNLKRFFVYDNRPAKSAT